MPVKRFFRGREVLRTERRGDHIEVVFRSERPGGHRPRLTVRLAEYEREVRRDFEPSQPQGRPGR